MTERPLSIDLTEKERDLLQAGLWEWEGPASMTDEFAIAMGFRGRDDFFHEANRVKAALKEGEGLSTLDWKHALLATEIAFASDLVGSGTDWVTSTGLDDAYTIELLRSVQRKVVRALAARMDRQR